MASLEVLPLLRQDLLQAPLKLFDALSAFGGVPASLQLLARKKTHTQAVRYGDSPREIKDEYIVSAETAHIESMPGYSTSNDPLKWTMITWLRFTL